MKNFLFILFFSYKIIELHSQDQNSNFSYVTGRSQLYSFLYYTICPDEEQVVNGIKYDKGGTYKQTLIANNGMDSILTVKIDIDSIIDLPFIENEVEMQVLSLPFNNQYFSGNLYEINKNLIAQPFASNAGIYNVASQIYAPAGNKKDVYFGGDSPQIHGFFDAASLVMSKEIFDDRDFPLKIEASFFSREKIVDYNEAYIWIGEANPLYYNTSTTVFPLNFESKTGLLIGGVTGRSLIFDLQDNNTSGINHWEKYHNFNETGSWFSQSTIVDKIGNILYIKSVKINGIELLTEEVKLPNLKWLSSYRIGLAIDDLASDFKIIKNCCIAKQSIISKTICFGSSITINNIDYSTTGTFTQNLRTNQGCDSTLIINIETQPLKSGQLNVSICNGDSLMINNISYKEEGKYIQIFKSLNGCDSILAISITQQILQSTEFNIEIDKCSNLISFFPLTQGGKLYVKNEITQSIISQTESIFYLPEGRYKFIYILNENLPCMSFTEQVVELDKAILEGYSIKYMPELFCEGDSINVFSNLDSSYDKKWIINGLTYENDTAKIYDAIAKYNIKLEVLKNGCQSYKEVNLDAKQSQNPSFDFSLDSCTSLLTLIPEVQNGIFYIQDFEKVTSLDTNITKIDFGNYNIEYVINKNLSCESRSNKFIEYYDNSLMSNTLLPNIIKLTESGGVNSLFCFTGINFGTIISFDLEIFDRWGNLCFKSTDSDLCWDCTINGKMADQGVYTYALKIAHSKCSTITNQIFGNVTLIK